MTNEMTLQMDPFKTVSSLPEEKKDQYENLPIPTLDQLLTLVENSNRKLLFDIVPYYNGIPESHPFATKYVDVIVNTIVRRSNIPHENVSMYNV